jgi:predicted RNA binding protein YcfA (HicA-like mRNA interferase family)
VIAVLRKAGFQVVRVKGSHHFLAHPDGRHTVVTVHRGEIIGPGLMSKILRDCEMTRDEFINLL